MALQNPVAVYTAASNAEAQLVRDLLVEAGIEAFAVEDTSPVGMYALGVVSQIHKPQVWVDRPSVEQARFIIVQYEKQPGALSEKRNKQFCYECGEPVQIGIPRCPACGGELDWTEDATAPGAFDTLKAVKKPFAWLLLAPFLFVACLAIVILLIALVESVSR